MLEINNVSMAYANGQVKAVDGLSFSLKPGEIFGFLGANGAGKTTTIKMATGILPIKSGSISVCGHDITKDPIAAKRSFGFVPDSPIIFDKYTGREYINFMADVYGVSKDERERVASGLLKRFSLEDAFDKRISGYSHGMKQKIAIIGALIHSPALWILDEPMIGLDPLTSAKVSDFMKDYAKEGNCILFSSHNINSVQKICDRAVIINKGVKTDDFRFEDFAESGTDLEEYFLSRTADVSEEVE